MEMERIQITARIGVFFIFIPGNEVGNLMHVQLISLEGLVYHFEIQKAQILNSQSSEGRVFLGHIDPSKYDKVVEIISKEPAPRNKRVKTSLLYVEHITDGCRIVVKIGPSNA